MSLALRVRLLVVPFVVVLALVGASGAAASPPTTGSGTITSTSTTLANPRQDGGNTTFDVTATDAYTGAFTGTSTCHGFLIFHPDGSATSQQVLAFTGTVDGVPGTVTFNLVAGSNSDGTYEGTATILSATGGLAGLHGVMTQVGKIGPNGLAGTYTAQLQLAQP